MDSGWKGNGMGEKVLDCESRLLRILGEMGRLNLWEIRAILGETRDFTQEVLRWLAAKGKIAYHTAEDQLCVSLSEKERRAYLRSVSASKRLVFIEA
jgi:hypothetical protein